jgi:hypothetical protein
MVTDFQHKLKHLLAHRAKRRAPASAAEIDLVSGSGDGSAPTGVATPTPVRRVQAGGRR